MTESAATLLMTLLMGTANGAAESLGKIMMEYLIKESHEESIGIEKWEYMEINLIEEFYMSEYTYYRYQTIIDINSADKNIIEHSWDGYEYCKNQITWVLDDYGAKGRELINVRNSNKIDKVFDEGTTREYTITTTYTLKRKLRFNQGLKADEKSLPNEEQYLNSFASQESEYIDDDCY